MATKNRRSISVKKLNCDQCKLQIIEEKEEFIECDKCNKSFHSQCTKIDKRQFEYLLKNESVMFTCHFCEGGEGGLKNELMEIKTKLMKLDQLSDIQESMQFMVKQYDEILKGVAENKKKLVQIEKENKMLKKEIVNLKTSVKMLNDVRVKNDCVVSGLTAADGTTAVESILKLSKSIDVDIKADNIEDAFFVGRKDSQKKTAIVKFCTKAFKDKLMSAKPKLKEIESTKSVYINDFLSKETLELFNYSKSIKKVGYQHVFVKNGRVLYKRSEISKPQVIRSEEDVDNILLNATTSKPWKRNRNIVKQASAVDDDGTSGDEDNPVSYVSPN